MKSKMGYLTELDDWSILGISALGLERKTTNSRPQNFAGCRQAVS